MIVIDTNLDAKNASSQYLNFNYNSMVKFNQQTLCASHGGLFSLENTANSEEDTDCFFELPWFDFGVSSEKRLRSLYISYESEVEMTLTIRTEKGISENYNIPATYGKQYGRKIQINRSLKGRFWAFKITSNKGSFSVDEISVLPIIRGHGFNGN